MSNNALINALTKVNVDEEEKQLSELTQGFADIIKATQEAIAGETVDDGFSVFQRPYDQITMMTETAGDTLFLDSFRFLTQEMDVSFVAGLSQNRRKARYVVCNILAREILRRNGFITETIVNTRLNMTNLATLINNYEMFNTPLTKQSFRQVQGKIANAFMALMSKMPEGSKYMDIDKLKNAFLRLQQTFALFFDDNGNPLEQEITISGKTEPTEIATIKYLMKLSIVKKVTDGEDYIYPKQEEFYKSFQQVIRPIFTPVIKETADFNELIMENIAPDLNAEDGKLALQLFNHNFTDDSEYEMIVALLDGPRAIAFIIETLHDITITDVTEEERSTETNMLSELADLLTTAVPHSEDYDSVAQLRLSDKVYNAIIGQLLSEPTLPHLLEMQNSKMDPIYKLIGHLYLLSSEGMSGTHKYIIPSDLDTVKSILTTNYTVEETPLHREIALMNVLLPCGVNMIMWQCITNQGMSGFVNKLYIRSRLAPMATIDALSQVMSVITGVSSDINLVN